MLSNQFVRKYIHIIIYFLSYDLLQSGTPTSYAKINIYLYQQLCGIMLQMLQYTVGLTVCPGQKHIISPKFRLY